MVLNIKSIIMNKLDYLIEELIKEDSNLSNIKIPINIDEKKDLYLLAI